MITFKKYGRHQVSIQCDTLILESLRKHFSAPNEDYNMQKRYNRFAQPRLYFITKTGRLPIGLLKNAVDFLTEKYPKVLIDMEASIRKQMQPKIDILIKQDVLAYTPHDYQYDCVKAFFDNGRGIINMGTGGGKTFSIALAFENIHLHTKGKWKALFLVPDTGLLTQAYKDFTEKHKVTFKVHTYTGKNKEPFDHDANVIIANKQMLTSKNADVSFIGKMDYIVIDECHELSNKESIIFDVIRDNALTDNILGLTGTLPDDKTRYYALLGLTGDRIYIKSGAELRQEGRIAAVRILSLKLDYKERPHYLFEEGDPASMFRQELSFIANLDKRNELICKYVTNFKKNSLILVDTREHGRILYEKMQDRGKQVFYINGSTEGEDREIAKKIMEEHNDVVIIAMTSIFSKGISINNLHMIIMADLSRSTTTIVQAIGRALRLHEDKDFALFIDLADINLKYSLPFYEKRLKIYQDESIKVDIKTVNL